MIKDNRRLAQIIFAGGLDLETPALTVNPGRMLSCKNFVVDTLGGYRRILGYERYDGQPQPHETDDPLLQAARRDAIQPVPGSGPVRGVCVYKGDVYALRNTSDGLACKMYRATATGWQEVTTPALNPGGKYQFAGYNFEGAASSEVIMGADGVNPAFVFDGTTFTQITIPGEASFPKFCAAHANHLFLGLDNGMLYYSAVGDPTNFDPLNNAGLIGVGDAVTGIYQTVGGALAVTMRNRVAILYGSSYLDWQKKDLRSHDDRVGALPYTGLTYNDLYYLDDRGLTSLQATQAFGNFQSLPAAKGVTPFLQSRLGRCVGAMSAPDQSQLRWFFSTGQSVIGSEVLTLTFSDGSVSGFSRQVLDHNVFCLAQGEAATGEPIKVAGTEEGYVMRLDVGTSFDGNEIEAYFRTAFWHGGAPRHKKHFKQAVFNISSQGKEVIRFKPLFNFGGPDTPAHRVRELDVVGGGASWGEGDWGEFRWSSQINTEAEARMSGTARDMAMLVYSKSATTKPFTIYDAVLMYGQRGLS